MPNLTNPITTAPSPSPRDQSGRLRATNRKGDMLTIRVSREEYDAITAAADRAKVSVNQWCRVTLVRKANIQ